MAFALLFLSSIGSSLAGVGDAGAEEEPKATEIPEVVDDKPIDNPVEDKTEEPNGQEEPKATESVTEVPEVIEDRPVETETVATETAPLPTEAPESGSTSEAVWAGNHLELDVHGCPAGVDAAASSPAQLEASCGDNVGTVAFTLDNGWLGTFHALSDGGSPGNHASFSNLDFEDDYAAANSGEGRPVLLTAALPAGYGSAVVSCAYWNETAGVTEWGPALMPMAGDRTIEIAVDAGDTLSCDWFFMPPLYQGQDEAVFEIPPIAPEITPEDSRPTDPVETGSVHIVKYTCAEGYDASGAGFATLEKECRANAVLTEFTVYTGGMYNETRAARLTLPPFMQEAEFEDVPATSMAIRETILPGFGRPIVYCAVGANTVAEWIRQPVLGGDTVLWDLEPKTRLDCYFFNIQVEGEQPTYEGKDDAVFEIPPIAPKPDTVRVIKHTCGKGILPNEEYFRLYDQCHEDPGPVEFTVRGEDGYLESGFSDGSIPQAAEFTGVPFGRIEITETIPDGYGEPLAFCSDGEGPPPPVAVDGDTVTWDLRSDADDVLLCIFFNFPEGGEKVDPDAGVVRISKRTCPADVSRDQFEDPYDFMDACRVDDDPVEFSVTSGAGYSESHFTTSYHSGHPEEAGFTGVPLGEIAISETVPKGYGEPIAFCTDTEFLPDGRREYRPVEVIDGNTITWDLQTTTWPVLRCHFFNISDEQGGTGTLLGWAAQGEPQATEIPVLLEGSPEETETAPDISPATEVPTVPVIDPVAPDESGPPEDVEPTAIPSEGAPILIVPGDGTIGGDPDDDSATNLVTVFTLACPADVARSGSLATLAEQCRVNPGAVEFSVTGEGGYSRSAFAPGAEPQVAVFADVPFGTIEISEAVPYGYGVPLAFCSDSADDGPGTFVSVPVIIGNIITPENRADAGSSLRCAFVNFPQGGGVEVEPDTGVVHISKYTCPAGYAPLADDYLMSEQCREDAGPVEFSIRQGASFSATAPTSGGVPGSVEFTDVPFGTIAITESVPAGYGAPLAFCTDTPADGAGTYEPVPVDDTNTMIREHRADAEIPLGCVFFNFMPDDDAGNQLTVTKFTCPEGTDRAAGLPDLGTTCDVMSGVEFTATWDGSSSTLATDGTGNARWDGVPAGGWSVQETVPEGYGDPVAFCGPMYTTEAPRVPAPGGLFEGEFAGTGEHMVCTVFNFMDGGDDDGTGPVSVSKYTCPAGYAALDDDYLMSEQCQERMDPVEFTINGPGGYSQARTGALADPPLWQDMMFTDVPYGDITIAETVPDGHGAPRAFCRDTPTDGTGAYEPVPVVDGNTIVVEHRSEAEMPLACLFFNFAGGDASQPGGSVTSLPNTGAPPASPVSSDAGAVLATVAVLLGILALALRPARDPAVTGRNLAAARI
jgi:hypothetical protein